ncbi:MAG: hypothetical protein CMF66_03035 [Magnetovibrio sp.]|nr:hypothetical protein [Magnetovibrio sp.]
MYPRMGEVVVKPSPEWVAFGEEIFESLPGLYKSHAVTNPIYSHLSQVVKSHFDGLDTDRPGFGPFADLHWPRVSAGSGPVDSFGFFCLVEFVIYSFYWRNRSRYRTLFDVGSNMGPDAIIAAKMGYEVDAFEPDPQTFELLKRNIEANHTESVTPHCIAISDTTGVVDFVRVKGNLMASHISGARDFFGDHEYFSVETSTLDDFGAYPDLIKINAEGSEGAILGSIPREQWDCMDALTEVHNKENRDEIFNLFAKSGVNIFAQKVGWLEVKELADMPANSKEGYIFISIKDNMPW